MTEQITTTEGCLPAEVAIVGGHGQIARLLTESLAERGVRVRSIIRNEQQSRAIREIGAEPVLCDLEYSSVDALADAFGDAEAVVFAAGAGPGSGVERKRSVDRDGALRAAEAALLSGAMRFVQVSFIGAEQSVPEGTDAVFAAYWNAKREADDALRGVALDWTIVKPGRLTDDPPTGRGSVSISGMPRGVRTRRGDVAGILRLVLENPATVWREISIAEGDAPLRVALETALAAASDPR